MNMASEKLGPTPGTGVPKTRKRKIHTPGISLDTVPILAEEEHDYTCYGEVSCEVSIAAKGCGARWSDSRRSNSALGLCVLQRSRNIGNNRHDLRVDAKNGVPTHPDR